jgi:hypothetical protein
VFVNGTVTALPTTNLVVAPGTPMTLLGTDNAPSPGTQYRFTGWSQSGNPLQFPMPPKPVSLTAKYLPFHSVTVAANPPAGGQVTIVNPSKDGYYQGGRTITLAVQPAFGFTFAGFSGDLTGTGLSFTPNAPAVITANFNGPPPSSNPGPGNPTPTISFMTNVPVPIPVTVGALTVAMPTSQSLQPGTVPLSVPPVYSLSQVPGVQYAFVRWSDGVTSPTRSFTVASSTTLIAEYVKQVLVQVVADPPIGGLLIGEGWYDVGSNVTITAKANPGAVFVRFFGPTQSTTNPVTLPVGSSPMTVGGIFQRQ